MTLEVNGYCFILPDLQVFFMNNSNACCYGQTHIYHFDRLQTLPHLYVCIRSELFFKCTNQRLCSRFYEQTNVDLGLTRFGGARVESVSPTYY